MNFELSGTAAARLSSAVRLLISIFVLSFICADREAWSAQIELVRADPNSLPVIRVSGDFVVGDEADFIKVALPIERAIVDLNSNGGNLLAGIEIGKAIRLKEYSTYVSHSGVCASACALAWLGGMQRFMEPGAQVGFHVAYVQSKVGAQESGQGNALVGAYLNQLGLPQSAILYVTAAAPEEMRWLSADEAKNIGIEVTLLSTAATHPTTKPVVEDQTQLQNAWKDCLNSFAKRVAKENNDVAEAIIRASFVSCQVHEDRLWNFDTNDQLPSSSQTDQLNLSSQMANRLSLVKVCPQ